MEVIKNNDSNKSEASDDKTLVINGSISYDLIINKETGEMTVVFNKPESEEEVERDIMAAAQMTLSGVLSTIKDLEKQVIIMPNRDRIVGNFKGTAHTLTHYLQELATPVVQQYKNHIKPKIEVGGKRPASAAQKPKPDRKKTKKTHRKK